MSPSNLIKGECFVPRVSTFYRDKVFVSSFSAPEKSNFSINPVLELFLALVAVEMLL